VTTHVGSFNTNYGYAGEWVDGTGLINLRARYYNPMNGQFITRDPFAGIYTLPSTLNGYSYANNNPIRYFDPSGKLVTELLGAALVGALIGGRIDLVVQLSSHGWKFDCVNWKDVGISAGAGAVAGLVGFITFGAMTAVLGTGLFAEITTGAVSGVFAGQYGRMTTAALSGKEQDAKNALFQPKQLLIDAALGGLGGGIGYGIESVLAGTSSESVWYAKPLERGVKIENEIGRSSELSQNFPVIDKWENGTATSIKSIDLNAKSYQNISFLKNKIESYVTILADWKGARWAQVNIPEIEIQSRELILAIPPGASQAQLQAISEVKVWAKTVGVLLKIFIVH
jgi:RHS repeat-associated protein